MKLKLDPSWHSSYEQNNYGELFYALIRVYQPEKVVELGTKSGYSIYHIACGLKSNGHGTLDCYDLWETYIESYSIVEQMIRNLNNPPWHSSYEENNYGELFYSLVRIYKPRKVVELGTLAGYSAYHIARGLRVNGQGILDCYDLWENYEFYSVPKSEAEKNLREFRDIVSLESRNVVDADKLYETVDILHVDVDNEGEILQKIIPNWIDKMRQLIIIEGGSKKRDEEEWMIRNKKLPIKPWLEDFAHRRGDIEYFTFEPFPSLTIIKKK